MRKWVYALISWPSRINPERLSPLPTKLRILISLTDRNLFMWFKKWISLTRLIDFKPILRKPIQGLYYRRELKTTSNYLFLSPRLDSDDAFHFVDFDFSIPDRNTEAFKQRQSRQEGIDLPIEQNSFYWHYWNRIWFDLEYQSRSKMTWFAHNVAVESIFSDEVRTVACWGLPTWITSFSFTCEQLGTDRGGIPERDRTFRSFSFPLEHFLQKDWEEFIYGLGLIGMNSD